MLTSEMDVTRCNIAPSRLRKCVANGCCRRTLGEAGIVRLGHRKQTRGLNRQSRLVGRLTRRLLGTARLGVGLMALAAWGALSLSSLSYASTASPAAGSSSAVMD